MVSREQLERGGLRAYELGRLKAAAAVALYLVPLTAGCMWQTGCGAECLCLGATALIASVWLRWRNREGVEHVTTALVAGSIPLWVGLVVASTRLEVQGACGWCAAAGVVAGLWLGRRTRASSWQGWVLVSGLAMVIALLGSLCLETVATVTLAVALVISGLGVRVASTATA